MKNSLRIVYPDATKRSLDEVLDEELRDFESFFARATGGLRMWSGQRAWARRLVGNENTVLLAPTGTGKSTLLMIYALYAATYYSKRVLYLVPTRALARQVHARLKELASNVGRAAEGLVLYDSAGSPKSRAEALESMSRCTYRVAVVTNSFFAKRHELFEECRPGVLVIDDVDSLLRSEGSIAKMLKVVGFSDDDLRLAREKVLLLQRMRATLEDEKRMEIASRLVDVERALLEKVRCTPRAQVVVASATARARGVMAKVMRDLLGIDASGLLLYGRDVTDAYLLDPSPDLLASLLKRLGSGGLLMLSPRHPAREDMERLLEEVKGSLEGEGYRFAEATPRGIEEFVQGSADFVYGYATYYGLIVRGLDAPERIKYVIFLGTPVFSMDLEAYLSSPRGLHRIALYLRDRGLDVGDALRTISRWMNALSPQEMKFLALLLRGKAGAGELGRLKDALEDLARERDRLREAVREILRGSEVLEVGSMTIVSKGGARVYSPDAMTYVQATGRTSRMLRGSMTHGLSIVVEFTRYFNLLKGLEARLSLASPDFKFLDIREVDLEEERKRIVASRSSAGAGPLPYESALLVVESPTKAATIARFFGRPLRRALGDVVVYETTLPHNGKVLHLEIVATRGHLYDLSTDPSLPSYGVLDGGNSITLFYDTVKRCLVCGNSFTYGTSCPRCGSTFFSDSRSVALALRKVAEEVDAIYVATDPDIEGEKIAYDVYNILGESRGKIKRVELHEITVGEFFKGLTNPRDIDDRLVEAEIYRRALDRLIGFSLSNRLKEHFRDPNMGAGRVQTPVLGLIIERYREHLANKCWRVSLELRGALDMSFAACLDSRDAAALASRATRVILRRVGTRVEEVRPLPPYTTDELLSDVARVGMPVGIAMRVAQDLFESGLITYHRTDSHRVSSAGIGVAMKYLEKRGLRALANPSHWGEGGAHEAIRPTMPLDAAELERALAEGALAVSARLRPLHLKVYDMIFRRFVASQMRPFRARLVDYAVSTDTGVELGTITGLAEVLEHGFDLVKAPRWHALPDAEILELEVAGSSVRASSRSPLYDEGEVVARMRALGLGRPSTYAKVIGSLKRHGYVVASKRRLKLVPTRRGIAAYEYLSEHYGDLVSVELTRRLEQAIDEIAGGRADAEELLRSLIRALEARGLMQQEPGEVPASAEVSTSS
ncbi:MAG: reverse gyrase [Desulfurococcaceae archaeon]